MSSQSSKTYSEYHPPLDGEIDDVFKEECIIGIDEAGRGPVLGPMVYAAAFCPISKEENLKKDGYFDSKQINEERREQLFDKLKESKDWVGWAVTVLSPRDLSRHMLRKNKHNLNQISHETAIELIRKIQAHGVNVKKIRVDTVGSPSKYEEILRSKFGKIDIIVCSKADSKYPIVGAASICAKVTRDKCISDWKFDEPGFESDRIFGSGYPGDPNTKAWLQKNVDKIFGYPNFIRFSWSTTKKLLEEKCFRVQWPEIPDESDGQYKQEKITTSFLQKKSWTGGSSLYKQWRLTQVQDF